MEHTEILTRYIGNFVDELNKSGLTDVVISPGSRSTPIAMMFAEHPEINHWVNMDERSAAFFALGIAKQQNKAVALVCTSGTAAANYYPAIVEAYYSRVPLLILTADRPHELRDVGAPQAIEQIEMYGKYVKWFHEMALPEASPNMLSYVRARASRAVYTANQGNAGSVHLNFPFREPLLPDFSIRDLWGETTASSYLGYVEGQRQVTPHQLDDMISELATYQRGLIVCGPQFDEALAEVVVRLANQWQIPILADPLSQLRTGGHEKAQIIESYDTILKNNKIRDQIEPEFIIRFGAMPISKSYLMYVKQYPNMNHIVVESHEGHREPTGTKTSYIYADPAGFCMDLADQGASLSFDQQWLQTWQQMNQTTKQILQRDHMIDKITEGHAVTYLTEEVPDGSTLYIGNSMPIRDIDTFLLADEKPLKLLGNRGANGIDGLTSSALGAAVHGNNVTLLIGDLSFFHDFNGMLVAKQYNISLTIVLINNNGGGIFSFLPQAQHPKHFEVLFGTPMNIDIENVVSMYGGTYEQPTNKQEFQQALRQSYQQTGLSVIEVKTDRAENVEWHKQKWQEAETALMELLKG
ncbi:2-succinyl-5-enolpyruvyl-6-hydroxy-3-cyclohexene-1-carboxylic-acid synthase [Radiobacillus sp. PE A8.2]|uniref:2-succinyl-5-enolpyruvyl-6-hydroxy-3- cyclohexene-1-carboxylic-acid synthase n=1 Tax=Radiobacillus sp. PE A8.2 TaxID=3380349 RepID=UPI00388DD295